MIRTKEKNELLKGMGMLSRRNELARELREKREKARINRFIKTVTAMKFKVTSWEEIRRKLGGVKFSLKYYNQDNAPAIALFVPLISAYFAFAMLGLIIVLNDSTQ